MRVATAWGTETGNADTVVPVRDRQGLRKADGRVFRGRIGRVADLVEQPRGGCGVQEVALSTLDHRRQAGARRIDVAHDVDLPHGLPGLVRRRGGIPGRTVRGNDPGVRAEEIDVPPGCEDRDHGTLDLCFAAHIHCVRAAADRRCHSLRRILPGPVGDMRRAFRGKALAERLADAIATTGDASQPCQPDP
jgi:hypothetical protein